MEDVTSGKHRKRFRKGKSGTSRERLKGSNSSQRTTNNVLACFSSTEKSYEKQIPRKHITQGRITTRPGLFHQGKCTSFVQRALCFSPTKKARMDEDLHRIIRLANGMPDEDSNHTNVPGSLKNVNTSFGIPAHYSNRTESMDVVDDSSILSEDFHHGNAQENLRNGKQIFRMSSNRPKNPVHLGHEKMGADVRKRRSPVKSQINALSSTSTSSNTPPSPTVIYSSPPLEEYEEFSSAATLPLNSKKELLFSGRDYLKEARERIKTIVSQRQFRQINKPSSFMNATETNSQEEWLPLQRESSPFNDLGQSPRGISPMVSQADGADSQMSSTRNQHVVDDFSPFPCILSPKTTILNPIEYLKRVEQASRQRERQLFDSGHESGHSHGSSLTNSQSKTNFSHDLQKSYNPFHCSLETNECFIPSQNAADRVLYQHSNRSFIDSPQAFKIRDGNFQFYNSQSVCANNNSQYPQDNLDVRLKCNMPCNRLPSELNSQHEVPGFQYLMNISQRGHSGVSLHNPCDLLDELDALDCDTIVLDSSIASPKVLRRPAVTKKQWGPPPSPPTPEHKFYRRKMF